MHMLRQTEVQILDICDRGQKELIDRKSNRQSSGGGITPTNYGSSHNNTLINKTMASAGVSHNNTAIEHHQQQLQYNQSMELRMGAPYYQNQYEKENQSSNQPRIVNNHQPMKLPSHQQTLYSQTIEDLDSRGGGHYRATDHLQQQ